MCIRDRYVRPGLQVAPLVVGGSGVHSFDERHPTEMPTALEAGTLNVPGIAGLGAGVRWLLTQGVEALETKENALARLFYETVREMCIRDRGDHAGGPAGGGC